jgi:hypothetical protein
MEAVDVSKLSDQEQLQLAKKLSGNIRASLPKELYAGSFTLKSKLPYKAASFREVLFHRLSDLAEVTYDLFEIGRLLPAFVLSRAVVETTALLFGLYVKTSEFLEKPDEDSFDEFLMKGMMGSKDGTTTYSSYNALKAIDRLDKGFPGLRDMYNTLCEFTHPNWSGVMGAYSDIEREKFLLLLGREHGNPPLELGLGPFIGSLAVIQYYYNALADKLKQLNDAYEEGRIGSNSNSTRPPPAAGE